MNTHIERRIERIEACNLFLDMNDVQIYKGDHQKYVLLNHKIVHNYELGEEVFRQINEINPFKYRPKHLSNILAKQIISML